MSNLDFLDYTDFEETSRKIVDNTIIVRGIYYGSEDLSWTEYEYTFDLHGNYISHREVSHYR